MREIELQPQVLTASTPLFCLSISPEHLLEIVDPWLRFVTVPKVYDEARRNGVETEKKTDKSINCDLCVSCVDLVLSYKLFWN